MDWQSFLMWAGGIIIGAAFTLTGWVINMIFGRIDKQDARHEGLETRFDAHRLYAAETFTTKNDVKQAKDEIMRVLERMEDKIDKK